MGEIAAKAAVQLLFSTGKSFTVDGLREKLREFFRQEVRALHGPIPVRRPMTRECSTFIPSGTYHLL